MLHLHTLSVAGFPQFYISLPQKRYYQTENGSAKVKQTKILTEVSLLGVDFLSVYFANFTYKRSWQGTLIPDPAKLRLILINSSISICICNIVSVVRLWVLRSSPLSHRAERCPVQPLKGWVLPGSVRQGISGCIPHITSVGFIVILSKPVVYKSMFCVCVYTY